MYYIDRPVLEAFLNGVVLAFALILPLGPQNAFVLNQSICAKNILSVATVVIICALSDTLLILGAAFGLTLFFLKEPWIKKAMLIFSVIFVWCLAYKAWNEVVSDTDASSAEEVKPMSLFRLSLLTFSISFVNPYAILDTVVTIGSTSLTYHDAQARIAFLSACIFISWCWFIALACFSRQLKKHPFFNRYRGKISALLMALAGFYLLFMVTAHPYF